jgi:hypothetical protein
MPLKLKIGSKYRFNNCDEKLIVTIFDIETWHINGKKTRAVIYGLKGPHISCSIESFRKNYTAL